MKFSHVEIGQRWFCPWCGIRNLELVDRNRRTARCRNSKCKRIFQVLIIALPDPNSKTGNKECGSKIKHETVDSAYQHADELKEIPHRARKFLCIYRCRFCDKYHVGHKSKVNKQRLNEFYLFVELEKQRNGSSQESLKQESALCQTPQVAERENGQGTEAHRP